MKRLSWHRSLACLGFAAALSFVAGAQPAVAATEDVGVQMEQEYGVVGRDTREGSRLNDTLDRVCDRIVQGVNQQQKKKRFRLKSAKLLGGRAEKTDKVINAFALPDGRIYVTLGLMRAIENSSEMEDELGFVVGHEVTHVVQKHGKGQSQKATQAGILAIVLGAVTKSDVVGQVAGVGAQAYVSSYGRKDEYRADKGGLEAMNAAGYDTDAAATMLARLKSAGEGNKLNALFASHPGTESRIKRVREMSRDLKSGRGIPNEER